MTTEIGKKFDKRFKDNRIIGWILMFFLIASLQWGCEKKKELEDGVFGESNQLKSGVLLHKGGAGEGVVLVAPLRSRATHLVDGEGDVLHSWQSRNLAGGPAFLQPDGSIYRAGKAEVSPPFRGAGGAGGWIEQLSKDDELLWSFRVSSPDSLSHDDFEVLPNGNLLLLVWERKSKQDVIAAGRDPERVGPDGLWVDTVVEVKPNGKTGGQIVWKWSVWDHLVQDFSADKPSFGHPRDFPGKIDLNFSASRNSRDWIHLTSVSYAPHLDQILLSARGFSEIWVIDHSTSRAEAKLNKGGKQDKGGRILFRWGNPVAWGRVQDERILFSQHFADWISPGLPGGGGILIFNNGIGRGKEKFSSVIEIQAPWAREGGYIFDAENGFSPEKPTWSFVVSPKESFFSPWSSSAQRLPSGNTLICSASDGEILEVSHEGDILWAYRNPHGVESGVRNISRDQDSVLGSETEKGISTSTAKKIASPIFGAYQYPKSDWAAGEGTTP